MPPSETTTAAGGLQTRHQPPIITTPMTTTATWTRVCELEDILPNTGVCALLSGRQIAVVRVGDSQDVFAIGNFDPFSKAFVLSRGIVGDRAGVAKIASPIFKQSFDLRTGICLDDAKVTVPTYPVRLVPRDGRVDVEIQAEAARSATGAE
jgi:nitrite reductase (NADH) small subunit